MVEVVRMGRGLGPLQVKILKFLRKDPGVPNHKWKANSTYRISRAILVRVDGKWDNYFNLLKLVQNVHHSLEALERRKMVTRIYCSDGKREYIWEITEIGLFDLECREKYKDKKHY